MMDVLHNIRKSIHIPLSEKVVASSLLFVARLFNYLGRLQRSARILI